MTIAAHSSAEQEYVLGTSGAEAARLRLQHAVWRPRAADAWRRAGFTTGQHILDVGCGPGFAALDLAEVVGPSGRVLALDRSRRFLDLLDEAARARGLDTIQTVEGDLDEGTLPALDADGAWCRWIFAFVRRPRQLLQAIGDGLLPGGVLVVHEYVDYGTWRLAPRLPELEEFVEAVMRSWRDAGGEPDIALDLPGWLSDAGFRAVELRPIVDVVRPRDFTWQWPATFFESGLERLVQLGYLQAERAAAIRGAFRSATAEPGVRMVTPAVLEIIAVRE